MATVGIDIPNGEFWRRRDGSILFFNKDTNTVHDSTPEEMAENRGKYATINGRDWSIEKIASIRGATVGEVGGGFTQTTLPQVTPTPETLPQAPEGDLASAPVEGEQVNTATPDLSQFGIFDRQLEFGMRGEDVKRLQQFLNASGFAVAGEGKPGGAGSETDFFGPSTQKALQAFQKARGIVSSGDPQTTGFGRFGPKTLENINGLISPTAEPDGGPASDGGLGALPEPRNFGLPLTDEELGQFGDPAPGTEQNNQVIPQTDDPELDSAMEELLNNPDLTDDQKEIARKLYDVISRNDKEQAERMMAAFEASIQFSDPFFKAQIAIATDSLQRALAANEGDLDFASTQLENTLSDLREDILATRGELDFTKEQQLKGLERSYQQDLDTTRQNLASVGKSSSSVRARKEQILGEEQEGLVEGTRRKFSFQTGQLERQSSRAGRDTEAQLKRLQDDATQNRIAQLRQSEQILGSDLLSGLGFSNLLGGQGGSIERNRIKDALSFSGNAGFVF